MTHAVPFITSLFDVGDELPETPPGFYVFGTDVHARRIIHFYLIREKEVTKRESILSSALRDTTGIFLPVYITHGEDDRHERKKDPASFLVGESALPALKAMCVERIRNAAQSGSLAGVRELAHLLYVWRIWTTPDEPRKWVQEVLIVQGVTKILLPFVSTSTSAGMGDHVGKVRKRIVLKGIEDLIPLDVVNEQVKALDRNTLTANEMEAVRAFEKAMERRRQGKPDDDWRDEDEE
ncbi:MAG: hypothetical protein AB1512_25285 [Thermodesulfobacteriota bacterium]